MPNMTLKAVYFCATSDRRWGKGLTLETAKQRAGVRNNHRRKKGEEYYVMAALFDNPTDEELDNLYHCITANPINGNPEYYNDNRSESDTEMIYRLHVGWLKVEGNN